MFQVMWPSLIKSDFITSLITLTIKVSKGKSTESFYTLTDYYNWKKANRNGKGWKIKYYKGLELSTSKEAKEYFRELKLVNYKWSNVNCDDSIDLAFNKDKADNRKDWLQKYDSETILDSNDSEVTYNDFIHKEFIHFSNEDLKRSVPCLCDGLKPTQRKVLYSVFKRNLKKEIKVAQLSGYVSEHAHIIMVK